MYLVEGKNLSKVYKTKSNESIYAVNDIDIYIEKGETLGLVGESGCGKSTLGKILLKLEQATNGSVVYENKDITNFSFNEMRKIRKNMQMIFQNSSSAFNPYFTVRDIIMEPLNNYIHTDVQSKELVIIDILNRVGLSEEYLPRFINQLSGGQRQRVGIARALVLKPEFVVCDEPTSSVDYAVRNQILQLLNSLKKEFNLTYLFISHDLSSIKKICDRVVVMYMGQIMEILPDVNENAVHPYTKALMSAVLDTNPRNRGVNKILFKEDESRTYLSGCVFRNRCLYSKEICNSKKPVLTEIEAGSGHFSACHLCNIK